MIVRAFNWCALAVAIAATIGLVGCSEPPPAAAVPSLTVTTVSPSNYHVPRDLAVSGDITAWEHVGVGVELSAARVSQVYPEVGSEVAIGDLLVSLDVRTLQEDVARATASLDLAIARRLAATRRAERGTRLAAEGLISRQDVETLIAERDVAIAEVSAARAEMNAARTRLSFGNVRSPVRGIVSERQVQVGQVVNPSDVLLRIIRDGRLEWRAQLTDVEIRRVGIGAAVTIVSDGVEIEGRVRQLSPAIDSRSRTGLAYVDLPFHRSLRAGQFVSGRIHLGEAFVLAVPASSLVARDGFEYLFTVDGASVAREHRVATGTRFGDLVELISGAGPNDRVVVQGASFLNDGDTVKVVESQGLPGEAVGSELGLR